MAKTPQSTGNIGSSLFTRSHQKLFCLIYAQEAEHIALHQPQRQGEAGSSTLSDCKNKNINRYMTI